MKPHKEIIKEPSLKKKLREENEIYQEKIKFSFIRRLLILFGVPINLRFKGFIKSKEMTINNKGDLEIWLEDENTQRNN